MHSRLQTATLEVSFFPQLQRKYWGLQINCEEEFCRHDGPCWCQSRWRYKRSESTEWKVIFWKRITLQRTISMRHYFKEKSGIYKWPVKNQCSSVKIYEIGESDLLQDGMWSTDFEVKCIQAADILNWVGMEYWRGMSLRHRDTELYSAEMDTKCWNGIGSISG